MLDLVILLMGVLMVAATLRDIFASVIVPRPARRRLRPSAYLARWGWEAWSWYGHSAIRDDEREDFLGTFAPLLLIFLLAYWVSCLIFGYALLIYALRWGVRDVHDLGTAVYFAGTSLLTIGYGDIVPVTALTRAIAIAAGASGFGVVAILTTYLFAIFGAYQSREAFVVALCNRAGAPPSGVELIEVHSRLHNIDGLLETFREAQRWMAAVLETHLAYPVLNYFRSTHDDISWVGALGAVLDASTLAITTIDVLDVADAEFANRLGRHFVRDFAHYFGLEEVLNVGIERAEFDLAYDRLVAAHIPVRERNGAWNHFRDVRSNYASALNALARYYRIPPAQWVGDRSLIGHQPPLRVLGQQHELATQFVDHRPPSASVGLPKEP